MRFKNINANPANSLNANKIQQNQRNSIPSKNTNYFDAAKVGRIIIEKFEKDEFEDQ